MQSFFSFRSLDEKTVWKFKITTSYLTEFHFETTWKKTHKRAIRNFIIGDNSKILVMKKIYKKTEWASIIHMLKMTQKGLPQKNRQCVHNDEQNSSAILVVYEGALRPT